MLKNKVGISPIWIWNMVIFILLYDQYRRTNKLKINVLSNNIDTSLWLYIAHFLLLLLTDVYANGTNKTATEISAIISNKAPYANKYIINSNRYGWQVSLNVDSSLSREIMTSRNLLVKNRINNTSIVRDKNTQRNGVDRLSSANNNNYSSYEYSWNSFTVFTLP